MDQEIKIALNKHEEHLKDCDEHFIQIDKKLKEHDKRFERIEEMIRDLQRSMLIIEDAVTNKIPALFDGYAMHQEKQEQLEERVNNLENFSETNSIRISALETITSENSKQLAQLLS